MKLEKFSSKLIDKITKINILIALIKTFLIYSSIFLLYSFLSFLININYTFYIISIYLLLTIFPLILYYFLKQFDYYKIFTKHDYKNILETSFLLKSQEKKQILENNFKNYSQFFTNIDYLFYIKKNKIIKILFSINLILIILLSIFSVNKYSELKFRFISIAEKEISNLKQSIKENRNLTDDEFDKLINHLDKNQEAIMKNKRLSYKDKNLKLNKLSEDVKKSLEKLAKKMEQENLKSEIVLKKEKNEILEELEKKKYTKEQKEELELAMNNIKNANGKNTKEKDMKSNSQSQDIKDGNSNAGTKAGESFKESYIKDYDTIFSEFIEKTDSQNFKSAETITEEEKIVFLEYMLTNFEIQFTNQSEKDKQLSEIYTKFLEYLEKGKS